ncbi:MAG TPA: squalene/phytoene synthase family protein [Xanthobacteraceae bacterium]|nr:squalene/phytoene synthase family protein [Xanthobacteraceae bacterium]
MNAKLAGIVDELAYCAELVRQADRDRFVASLFAPAEKREALYGLYAFNAEIARVREAAHAALPGEIRLQWWSDVIAGERGGEARANPVAAALLTVMERYRLPPPRLIGMVEARRFDLYDEPMRDLAQLETYARQTSSALFALAAQILAEVEADAICVPAGVAYAVTGLLSALPLHVARRQFYLPTTLLAEYGVDLHDLSAGHPSPGLGAALGELRAFARRKLVSVREQMSQFPPPAIPALLPLAIVGPLLDRLERSPAFRPAEISLWRRQWLIWRAARNPKRIAR